ncbi:hypothetical protein NC652_018412 [Populus alba x Populus x berolinensis]|nr:hypothetical protein NC652_018412 [Populus alba x Populus x berolinensis]
MASSTGNPSYSEHDSEKFHCYYSNKHKMYACIFVHRSNLICNYWNNCWRLFLFFFLFFFFYLKKLT